MRESWKQISARNEYSFFKKIKSYLLFDLIIVNHLFFLLYKKCTLKGGYLMSGEVQEKWLKWVGLTTTILAVCAAIGSLKGGGFSTQVQVTTTLENNKWSYFQAKSIKQHVTEMERDLLQLEQVRGDNPTVKAEIQQKLKTVEENIGRYDNEKSTIKSEADALSNKQTMLKRHGGNFGLCVMFCQIAIMLSAIGSLLKQKYSWILGLVIGGAGIVYFFNGFFLFF
jgi:hypothetical protein